MLLDIIGEIIGKFIGDSINNKSLLGLIIAIVISVLCLVIAIILFLNGKNAISFIFILLSILPFYIRNRIRQKHSN